MDKEDLRRKAYLIKLKDKTYPCPTSLAMELIGGKWKSVILAHLMKGKKRYNELRKEIPTITERTLSLQLKKLEEDGLIVRKVYTKKPPLKVDYTLTEFGKTLIPVLHSIIDWGVEVANAKCEIVEVGDKARPIN